MLRITKFNYIWQSSSSADAMSDLPRRNVSAMRGDFEKNGVGDQRGVPRSPSGHIKELKSLGKDMSGGEEGTFNFQVTRRDKKYNEHRITQILKIHDEECC